MEFLSGVDTLYADVSESPAIDSLATAKPSAEMQPGEPTTAEPTTVVLLHPTPLNHTFWSPVLSNLRGYRLLIPDLRGHGRSGLGSALLAQPDGTPTLTVEQLAQDALALLDSVGATQAILVGCSIGGYTLYELWRTAPERIRGLVFASSKPQADNDAERAKRVDWIAKHQTAQIRDQQKPSAEFIDAMLAALLSKQTRRDHPDIVAQARSMMEQVQPLAIQAIQRGLAARPDSRDTARTITVPACVIAGAEDASSTPSDMAALYRLLAEGGALREYHVIEGAGHYAPLEQPNVVGDILEHFCRKCHQLTSAER